MMKRMYVMCVIGTLCWAVNIWSATVAPSVLTVLAFAATTYFLYVIVKNTRKMFVLERRSAELRTEAARLQAQFKEQVEKL